MGQALAGPPSGPEPPRVWRIRGPGRLSRAAPWSLLGLLLAFSFGMVLTRYEARRELVVREANAIGTSYLRAQFLNEPYRTRLSTLLVEYAENRVQLASAEGNKKSYLATNDRC